ncbi:MAG TPA: fructose-6-phosphate aldolase [Firmicutes bacterium]|jgi:transaldolase|nr:fructose-6-phosphate aldolase [Bacillota bacterium]
MKFFLDSANFKEIEEAHSWGVVSGVTTNPSLVSKEKGPFDEIVKKICNLMPDCPVSVEVLSTVSGGMVEEAHRLAALADNVVIKIPMGAEGLKAVHRLSTEGKKVPCNVTLVFSANQALLASRAGAAYVSPFIGRIDDIGWDGTDLVKNIMNIFTCHELDTKVIAASIRHPLHVEQVAAAGAHIATVPFSVLGQMSRHPLTDLGIERFLADWGKTRQEERI